MRARKLLKLGRPLATERRVWMMEFIPSAEALEIGNVM
jgi:hypothetical protein